MVGRYVKLVTTKAAALTLQGIEVVTGTAGSPAYDASFACPPDWSFSTYATPPVALPNEESVFVQDDGFIVVDESKFTESSSLEIYLVGTLPNGVSALRIVEALNVCG